MGVRIRPEIHERFARVYARAAMMPEPASGDLPGPIRPIPANTKLCHDAVTRMRDLRAEGWTLSELARRFDVTISTVHRATTGVTWRRVP